jgi:hypothetical protein
MLPRFRFLAVSMECLHVGSACIAAIPLAMISLDAVVMVEEPPAVATAPALSFEQRGPSRTGIGMPSSSRAPVHPIAIGRCVRAMDWTRSHPREHMREEILTFHPI